MDEELSYTLEEAVSQQLILSKEILTNNNLKPALLDKYKALGEEIALIKAHFKCENCDATSDLTIHHLVSRKNKLVVPLQKFLAQNRFHMNLAILCQECHSLVDGQHPKTRQSISEERINKTKKIFGIKEVE